jgi:hypothetical protein
MKLLSDIYDKRMHSSASYSSGSCESISMSNNSNYHVYYSFMKRPPPRSTNGSNSSEDFCLFLRLYFETRYGLAKMVDQNLVDFICSLYFYQQVLITIYIYIYIYRSYLSSFPSPDFVSSSSFCAMTIKCALPDTQCLCNVAIIR